MSAAIPSKQKAVEVDKFAGDQYLDHVHVVERDVPQPGQGEVLVQVYLRPINPTDLISIKTGYYGAVPAPLVPGSEGVGKVVKLGPGASSFKEGQRVIAAGWPVFSKGFGSWQQIVAMPEQDLVAVPDGIDDETAAQAWINPPTAYGLLNIIGAPKGEYVLQTAANSVVGKQIITLAKQWGIKTINLVRRESAVEELKELGADEVLVTGKDDIVERVKAITGGKGVYGAADAVGGALTNDILSTLRHGGTVYVYGVLAKEPLQIHQGNLLFGGKGVHGFIFTSWLATQDKRAVLQELLGLMEQKVLPVGAVDKTFPLDEVKEALKAFENITGGQKVLLKG